MTASVSIVIPAYNGKSHLEANLPPLLDATRGRTGLEVIVVDDGSADATAEFLAGRFPQVTSIALGHNRGFAGACNAGAHAGKGDLVYFLNSDARVPRDFLDPVIQGFGDATVFAVGSREVPPDGRGRLAVPVPFFRFGLFGHRYLETPVPAHPVAASFVSAGHAAFAREKFVALGGFDELYRPFYWEDIDLCYRAWRRGWKVLLDPRSVVDHAGQGTIARFFPPRRIREIYWKNRFLFIWKNVRDRGLVAQHLACLPLLLAGLSAVKGRAVLGGFVEALGQLREALGKRRRDAATEPTRSRSDREILRMFVPRA